MNATKISIRLDELKARYHGQNAEVDVFAQSAWPECDSKYIYTTKES